VEKWMAYSKIHELKQKGFTIAAIARKVGLSRNTVYQHLNKSPEEFSEWLLTLANRAKKLDQYQDRIIQWLQEHPDLTGAQVHDWLKEHYEGFAVGESTVRNYVADLREKYSIPKVIQVREYQVVEEMPMGKQVQVDFGEITVQKTNGGRQKLWFIAFVLSHSRYKYVEWLDRPFTTRDVIQCHEAAFHYYGGRPEEIVYDQDHLISVSENAGDLILTEEFQAYQQMRKFSIYLCRKSDPESKGKIENVVKYIKYNFSKNRVYSSLDVWNEQCIKWLSRTGNYNVHYTTKKRPFEVHALEKQHLQKVSTEFSFENNYKPSITRNIRKDNVIVYLSNRYSVPIGTYQPKKRNTAYLEILEDDTLNIRLTPDGEIIATHKVTEGKGQLLLDQNHKRKPSTKLGEWEVEIKKKFRDQDKINQFMSNLKERYPRHMGDQLSILSKLIQQDGDLIHEALEKVMEYKLNSANDFRDVLYSLKHETAPEAINHQYESPYSHINASTRNVESYIEILKGGHSA
jgi:transposase